MCRTSQQPIQLNVDIALRAARERENRLSAKTQGLVLRRHRLLRVLAAPACGASALCSMFIGSGGKRLVPSNYTYI